MTVVMNVSTVRKASRTSTIRLNSNNAVQGTPITTVIDVQSTTKLRDSIRTVGFHSRKRPRILPMNPFFFSSEELSSSSSTVKEQFSYYYAQYTGTYQPVFSPPYLALTADQLAAVDAMARTKVLNKSKDTKINLAQAIAEREQTIRLIAETATQIAKAYQQVRKGNLREAADTLGVKVGRKKADDFKKRLRKNQPQASANGWLGLQYGWKPLIDDAYGAAEFLAQKVSEEIINKATSSHQFLARDSVKLSNRVGGFNTTDFRQTKYVVKYTLYFSEANPHLHSLSQLGITNPALIAWELTPFSFVVDWFIPIGNYLASLDATLGLAFNRGCRTAYKLETVNSSHIGNRITQSNGAWMSGSATNTATRVSVTRTILTNWPSTSFPPFKNPLSVDHALNAIALLTTSFRK